jgi:hypothetical protein
MSPQPQPQGQVMVSGSMVFSIRGKCSGSGRDVTPKHPPPAGSGESALQWYEVNFLVEWNFVALVGVC